MDYLNLLLMFLEQQHKNARLWRRQRVSASARGLQLRIQ